MFGWLQIPIVKWFFPVVMLAAVAPVAFWFFRRTWAGLEAEATALRQELAAAGRVDYRPLLTLTLGVLIIAMQDYYGQIRFYEASVTPFLMKVFHADSRPAVLTHLTVYGEAYGRTWWGVTRIAGYVLPYLVWRFAFPRDSLLDMGLRVRGLRRHAWLYALFIVIMIPILFIVSRQPDFGAYYPICSTAGRSWLEFAGWELVYVGQFVALEMFFRGWWIRTTRIFGVGAIFSMVVPYAMIHFGKPYLEACSAIIAGVVLGSLAIETRSIWAGVLVHVTVAILNDILALEHKNQLPTALVLGGKSHFAFPYWRAVIGAVWGLAFVVVMIKAIRSWPQARSALEARRARRSD